MRCCGRIWMSRKSNAPPRERFWHVWSMSMTRTACRIRRCATTFGNVARRSRRRRVGRWKQGLVPQTYRPGTEAEVDFHDLWVVLAGVKTTTALFTMRLSFSGWAAHRPKARRRSWKATSTGSPAWAGYRSTRSATTTSTARSSRCCSGGLLGGLCTRNRFAGCELCASRPPPGSDFPAGGR